MGYFVFRDSRIINYPGELVKDIGAGQENPYWRYLGFRGN